MLSHVTTKEQPLTLFEEASLYEKTLSSELFEFDKGLYKERDSSHFHLEQKPNTHLCPYVEKVGWGAWSYWTTGGKFCRKLI